MELSEKQKQTICDYIEHSLEKATLQNLFNEDENALPLLDFLSTGDTIKEGKEEIANLVEQIYFDMDNWHL